jgi:hypothetical protein
MKVVDFQAANVVSNSNNCDLHQYLSPFEIKLCSMLTRVEIVGKRGNVVPVLLTAAFKKAIDCIIDKRCESGVPDTNVYVFARPQTNHHFRGSDALRKYANECGAKSPEMLRGTALRKHVATISQVLNLKDNELDLLAQFMGHNIRVHREFYRLPSDLLQTAKVAKILVAMESGQQQCLAGQSLDDINLDMDEGNYYFSIRALSSYFYFKKLLIINIY